ncbi:MAG: hypothetical protein ACLP6G_20535 [Terriglobales bacterium]
MPAKTSQTEPQPSSATRRWLHFLAPSASDVIFVTLLFGLSCGALGRLLLRDAGIGWHLRNGQQMLLTHASTRTDSFSSTMNGKPWYAWEWLYDVVFAMIHQALGLNGVVFYTAAIIAATFVLTLHLGLRRGGNLPITLLLLILALASSAVHFLARPHVLSWLLTVVWFELLDSAAAAPDSEQKRGLFWLPAVMLLWVNVHGGFVLGFVLLAVYLAGGVIEYYTDRQRRDEIATWLKRLSGMSLLVVAVSLVNPYTYQLHLHVYRYLTDRFLMDRISEFLSPDFHGAAQQCFAVLVLITIVAVAGARQRLSATHLVVLLVAVYGGFYATRSLPTSSLLIVLLMAPVISESVAGLGENTDAARWLRSLAWRTHSFGGRMGKLEENLQGHLWLVLVFVLGLWACAHQGRIGSTQFINAYFDEKRFPVEAAEAISQRGIHGPVFSLDYWGGYLIYRLYPGTQVVVDDRHDLYGDEFFKDYLKVVLVQPGWDEALDKLQVDWVLMPTESPLANILRLKAGWDVAYEDKRAVLLRRVK